jgi:hypothetical protein
MDKLDSLYGVRLLVRVGVMNQSRPHKTATEQRGKKRDGSSARSNSKTKNNRGMLPHRLPDDNASLSTSQSTAISVTSSADFKTSS